MRTLLKNTLTGQYFQGVTDWTERLHQAFDFQTPERLVRFIRASGLNPEHFELVFCFQNPRYNLSLPIDERFGVGPIQRRMAGASPALEKCTPQPPSEQAGSPARFAVTGSANRRDPDSNLSAPAAEIGAR